jgi:hypothetical protein
MVSPSSLVEDLGKVPSGWAPKALSGPVSVAIDRSDDSRRSNPPEEASKEKFA